MSQFSIDYFKDFDAHVGVDGYAPDVQWQARATLRGRRRPRQGLEEQHRTQSRSACAWSCWIARSSRALPVDATDDLALGLLSPEDGWLDPNSVLQGFRKKAQALGAVVHARSRGGPLSRAAAGRRAGARFRREASERTPSSTPRDAGRLRSRSWPAWTCP
jgi:glycine/D-amino acid oxidase-like deaminating enzyme